MSGVQIAFYIKEGDWTDRLVRWRTSSNTSHCELVIDGYCISSSPRDGGVRCKIIDLSDGWEVFDVPIDPVDVWSFFMATDKSKYDWLAAVIGQGFAAKVHMKGRWFCSEWCAAALGFVEPWRYHPALLRNVLRDQTRFSRAFSIEGKAAA